MANRLDPKRASPNVGSAGKDEASFWRKAKSGDFISLSDSEAFDEVLASGGEGPAIDYLVGEVRAFALRGPGDFKRGVARLFGEYRFIELARESASKSSSEGSGPERGSGPIYLAVIDVPGKDGEKGLFELRLYFIPTGLDGGTRDDLIDRGDSWLFLPPPNPEDFISSDLEYAPYPDLPEIETGGRSVKYIFSRVGPAVLYGEALDTKAPVIIAEYEAEPGEDGSEAENPLFLVLEEGWMQSDGSVPEEGGYLTLMLGKVMRTSDVELWQA
jgi:hypothetical protein